MKNARLVIVVSATLALLGTMLTVIPVKAADPIIDVYPGKWVSPPGSFNPGTHYVSDPIQDAVNSGVPPSSGSSYTIIVHTGTYLEYVTIDSSKSGLKLVARGPNVILDGQSCTLPYGFELIGADYVLILDFTIQHYADAGVLIRADYPFADRAIGNIVWRNVIQHNCGHGVAMDAADGNWVQTNTIESNGKHGVYINDGFTNKIVRANTVLSNKWNGIELDAAIGTEVKTNKVTSNSWNGLFADVFSSNTIIKANTFNNNNDRGIFMMSDSNTISDNTINANQLGGIMMMQGDNNLIEKNQINSNGYIGIFIIEGFWMNTADFNTIWNNEALNNAQTYPIGYDLNWLGAGSGNDWGTTSAGTKNIYGTKFPSWLDP